MMMRFIGCRGAAFVVGTAAAAAAAAAAAFTDYAYASSVFQFRISC
jgi:hypothetical protein